MKQVTRVFWKIFFIGFGLFLALILSINLGLFGKLPSLSELENPSILQATEVYAADGTLMANHLDCLSALIYLVRNVNMNKNPYPEKAFANINPNVKGIITVEENATGQMIDDAALAIKKTHKDRNIPAYALTYVYNTPPINRIKEDYFKVKSGEIKEVY